jgi:hypothetical protein
MVQKQCTNLCAKCQKVVIYHLTSDLKKVYNSAAQFKIVYKYLVSVLGYCIYCSYVLYLWMETVTKVFKKCIYLANRWWVWTRSISSTLPRAER